VAGDLRVGVRADEATSTLLFDNVDETGAPIPCNLGSFSLYHRAARWGYGSIGMPFSELRVSPVSTAFSLDWARMATDFVTQRRSFAGTLTGIAGSQTITNPPSDLRHVVLDVTRLPAPAVLPLVFDWWADRIDPYSFGIAYVGANPAPVAAPFAFDWWAQLPPGPDHFEDAAQLVLLPWSGGPLPPYDPAMLGPALLVNRGWPLKGALDVAYAEPVFAFAGTRMALGEGPPVWRGVLLRQPTALQLMSDAHLGLSPHLAFDEWFGQWREPDPAFTLTREGLPYLADTLRGAGGFEGADVFTLPITPARYRFHTTEPYALEGRPATLDVEASFDATQPGSWLPSLRALQVGSGAEPLVSIPLAFVSDPQVRFQLAGNGLDPNAEPPWRAVSVRPAGSAAWTELPVGRDSAGLFAPLPTALSGDVGLRIEAADAYGDTLRLTWDRAFAAEPGAGASQVAALDASCAGRVGSVRWSVSGAAGAQAVVQRRETATAWSAMAGVRESGGIIAFTDSSLVAGHAYGYRLALSSQGPPYSPEIWIHPSPGLELAIAGMRPNPGAADQASIEFTLPTAAPARLALYDLAGRESFARELGALAPGQHVLRLAPPRTLEPGIYFVRLSQGGASRVRRACLLR